MTDNEVHTLKAFYARMLTAWEILDSVDGDAYAAERALSEDSSQYYCECLSEIKNVVRAAMMELDAVV